ncbi:hypothetical protein [Streptomyces sp. NPDC006552]|uniref:hypothetical protein n=1 Tax=Streptomyces sp. NPDC006552 TaxID=3157179 RepID=UPI0033B49AFA
MHTQHCTVDGWVDAIPAPGPNGTAAFDLIIQPADLDIDAVPVANVVVDDTPDTVITCTSDDPRITRELLNGIQPGDLLRVTGTLAQPPAAGKSARLTVGILEVLDTGLIPVLSDMVLDRYADYVVIFDGESGQVPVFTASGRWAGLADNPDAIATLIDTDQRVNGGDA